MNFRVDELKVKSCEEFANLFQLIQYEAFTKLLNEKSCKNTIYMEIVIDNQPSFIGEIISPMKTILEHETQANLQYCPYFFCIDWNFANQIETKQCTVFLKARRI